MIITNTNNQFRIVSGGKTEFYKYEQISNVAWVKNSDGYYVQFTYEDDYFVKINLSQVENQPTWTNTAAGAEQAVATISTWINTFYSSVSATLTQILTTLQAFTEYEASFVKDANGDVFLEVRVWDQDTGTWSTTPEYYAPNSNVAVVPVAPITYLDPSSALAAILAELIIHTGLLTNIDSTTTNMYTEQLDQGLTLDSIETLITTLNSIVSTEATLQSVLAELQAINIDTNGLSQEATQLLVLAAINNVVSNTTGLATEVTLNALLTAFNAEDFATETTLALLNSNTVLGNITLNNLLTAFNAEDFATETTLQSVLTELQGINLDTNGLSQEATQLLVLAALNNIFADTTAILADTANLDVPLSTLATEVTLQSVLTAINNISTSGLATEATLLSLLNAFNAEDFATETTLALIEAITSQMTFTGGSLNVALPAGVQTPSILRVTGGNGTVAAGATSVAFFNAGDQPAVVALDSLLPGERVYFSATAGKTLGAISYDVGAPILGQIRDLVISKVV